MTIEISDNVAKAIAKKFAQQSDHREGLVDVAVLAMDNLLQSEAGKDLLNKTLKEHGMVLDHVPGWETKIPDQPSPVKTAKSRRCIPLLQQINRLITAFQLTEGTLAQFGTTGLGYDLILQGAWDEFNEDDLIKLKHDIAHHVLQPQHRIVTDSCAAIMVDIVLLETNFKVTQSMYAEAGLTAVEMVWIEQRQASNFDEENIHRVRELVRAYLLNNL